MDILHIGVTPNVLRIIDLSEPKVLFKRRHLSLLAKIRLKAGIIALFRTIQKILGLVVLPVAKIQANMFTLIVGREIFFLGL